MKKSPAGRKPKRFSSTSSRARYTFSIRRRCCKRSGKSTNHGDLSTTANTTHGEHSSSSSLPGEMKDRTTHETVQYKSQHLAIASLYAARYYDCSLPLLGKGGICSLVSNAVGCHRAVAIKVIKRAKRVLDENRTYRSTDTLTRPEKRKIQPGSLLEHIVSVYRERHSITTTTDLLNTLRNMDLPTHSLILVLLPLAMPYLT